MEIKLLEKLHVEQKVISHHKLLINNYKMIKLIYGV